MNVQRSDRTAEHRRRDRPAGEAARASRRGSEALSCPAAACLETWVAHDWASGLQIEHLPHRESFTVQTLNSRYELTILSGQTGDVLVRGGRFFPEATAARLVGSSLGGSFLKLRGIYVGFRMELYAHQESIITSHVRSIDLASVLDRPSLPLFP